MSSHRSLAAAFVIALSVSGVGAFAAPAGAETGHSSQHVWVTFNANGSKATLSSQEVHPGAVTLTFRAGAKAGASATVVSLRRGTTLTHFLGDLTTAASQTAKPADVIKAIDEINKTAVAYGGGDTLPGKSVTNTIILPHAGTYYLVSTASSPAVSLATIEAEGSQVNSDDPDYSATVTLGDETRDVITTAGELPSRGTIQVRNDGNGIHLLQMTRVAQGVTDAQVQAEYDQILAGKQPTSDPAGLMSRPTVLVGSDALSPERSNRLSYDVPDGTYLLQCFVPDDMTGLPHAFMGMHKVVVID